MLSIKAIEAAAPFFNFFTMTNWESYPVFQLSRQWSTSALGQAMKLVHVSGLFFTCFVQLLFSCHEKATVALCFGHGHRNAIFVSGGKPV